jgi:hypothetical protein
MNGENRIRRGDPHGLIVPPECAEESPALTISSHAARLPLSMHALQKGRAETGGRRADWVRTRVADHRRRA